MLLVEIIVLGQILLFVGVIALTVWGVRKFISHRQQIQQAKIDEAIRFDELLALHERMKVQDKNK